MAYKSRQYSEKDGHKMMAIIAQKKSYKNEQDRKRMKKNQRNELQMFVRGDRGKRWS